MDYVNDVRLGPQGAFEDLKIDSSDFLMTVEERSPCPKCHKSRKYFCYTCYIPMESIKELIPCLKLPIKIDIIKYAKEIDGKSTATHAAILAPDNVNIYTFPDFPSYLEKEKVLLIFPGRDSIALESLIQKNQRISNPSLTTDHSHYSDKTKDDCSLEKSLDSKFESSLSLQCENDAHNSSAEIQECVNTKQKLRTCITHSEIMRQVNILDRDCNENDSCETGTSGDRTLKCCNFAENKEGVEQSFQCSYFKNSQKDMHKICGINKSNHSSFTSDKCNDSCGNEEINEISKEKLNSGEFDTNSQKTASSEFSTADIFPCFFPYEKAVFIDCTWNQVHKIIGDERLQGIQQVELTSRQSKFWRFQRGKPHTYLSTIEAIYYFLVDTYTAVMEEPYCGQYDNLLFFFKFMYNKIHSLYDPSKMRVYSFKNPSKIPRRKQCLKANVQK